MIKREDVIKQGFCKYSEENSYFGEVPHYYLFNFFFFWGGGGGGWHLFDFEWEGEGVGWRWVQTRSWALIRINTVSVACEKNPTFRDATTGFCKRRLEFPYWWQCFLLLISTNQKHYPCQIRVRSRHQKKFLRSFLDRQNQRWHRKMSAVFSGKTSISLRLRL